MTVRDDEWLEQIEYDPRWEVQPEPYVDDEPGGNMRLALLAAMATVVLMGLLAGLVMQGPSGF